MKKPEKFKALDTADSLAAAASALDVPLEVVKRKKREGCPAFQDSRVNLRTLAEAIAADEPVLASTVLEIMVEQIAEALSDKNIPPDDAEKLALSIHQGFGAAILVLEFDHADQFLKQSAKIFDRIRKAATSRAVKPKPNGSKMQKGKL